MKKKKLSLLLLSAFLFFCISTGVSGKTITLRMASQNPESSNSHIYTIMPWVKKLEEVTNNQVKVEVYASQTLVKGKDAWEGVKNGIADMSWCFHGYWPGMTPLADVISLPALGFDSAEKGSEVLWKLYEKFPSIQKEFSDNKVLLFYTSHPYILITKDKQVKTIEDLQGLKIRMTGGPPTEMMKALGGIPMMIPMPDNYISLQKGIIDGMGSPWEALQAFRLYEVVNYYTAAPFPAVYFSVVMNKKKWDTLPEDIQTAIMSISGLEGSKWWGHNWFDMAQDRLYEQLKDTKFNIDLYKLPADEKKRWLEQGGKPVWENWVKEREAKGLKDAKSVLDATLEMLEE